MERRPVRSRRDGSNGAGLFTPLMADPANLALWLRADTGITTSNASVPNDMMTWAVLTGLTRTAGQADPVGGTSAIKVTDTVDGAPQQHFIQNALTNMITGPQFCDLWVKNGTITELLVTCAWSGAYTLLNILTGTISASLGAWSVRVLEGTPGSGNWIRVRLTNTDAVAGSFLIMTSKVGVTTYQGDGTGTVFFGTGATYGPTVTQNRVSQWDDQSGLANHATQGTAGSQMLLKCYDGGGNWVPMGAGGGNCEIGWPLDVAKNMTLPSSFANLWDGDIPFSVVVTNRRLGTITGNSDLIFWRRTALASTYYPIRVQTAAFAEFMNDGTTTVSNFWGGTPSTSWESLVATWSGTSLNFYQNGVLSSGSPIACDLAVVDMVDALLNTANDVMKEIAVYKSALSSVNRRLVENGMRARWGLPLL